MKKLFHNTLHPRMLCAKFGEIGPVDLEKKLKMRKVYRRTDKQTGDRQQVIRKAQLGFQLIQNNDVKRILGVQHLLNGPLTCFYLVNCIGDPHVIFKIYTQEYIVKGLTL